VSTAHYVYRAYNAAGQLLYVGMTGNPARRAKMHRSRSPWWHEAARFRLVGPLSQARAAQMEEEAIWSEGPIYNRPHASDFPAFGLPTYSQAHAARWNALCRARWSAPSAVSA